MTTPRTREFEDEVAALVEELAEARDESEQRQRCLVAHHNIAHLSDDVLWEWGRQMGSEYPVCRKV